MRLFSVVQMHFLFLLLVPVLRTHCLIGFLSTGTAFFRGSAPVLTVPNTLPEIGVRKFPVCWFLVVESNQHHFTASSSSNWTSLNISFSRTDTIIAWLFFPPFLSLSGVNFFARTLTDTVCQSKKKKKELRYNEYIWSKMGEEANSVKSVSLLLMSPAHFTPSNYTNSNRCYRYISSPLNSALSHMLFLCS